MKPDCDVLVIGAGPAGLTAAWCLARDDASVIVIEQDEHHVGGLGRTVECHGLHFDLAHSRLTPRAPAAAALVDEILPGGFEPRRQPTRACLDGRYLDLPSTPFATLFGVGPLRSAGYLASYAWARAFPAADAGALPGRARNRFGARLCNDLIKPYAEKIWGMPWAAIPAGWLDRCIGDGDLTALLRRAWRDGPATTLSPLRPMGGTGAVWQAAAHTIANRGGQVLMGHRLDRLSHDDRTGVWTVTVARADGRPIPLTARHVISSAPVHVLVSRIAPAPISLLHARALKHRDLLSVALVVDGPNGAGETTIHIHDSDLRVTRVRGVANSSAQPGHKPATSGLALDYYCFEGDALWASSDTDLVKLATCEVARLGLARQADVIGATVIRQPRALPVDDDAGRDNMRVIRRDLRHHCPNLHLVGCNGMHRLLDLDEAMASAMLTAHNIVAGRPLHDPWQLDVSVFDEEMPAVRDDDDRRHARLAARQAVA